MIGCDIDGVLADVHESLLAEAIRSCVVPEDAVYERNEGRIEDKFNLSDDELMSILTPRMFREAAPMWPAIHSLRRWMKNGERVASSCLKIYRNLP